METDVRRETTQTQGDKRVQHQNIYIRYNLSIRAVP
jgi:hypothetical protein